MKQTTLSYFTTPLALARKFSCPLIVTLGTSFRTKGEEVADESWAIDRFGMTTIGELVDPVISEVIETGSPPLIQMLPGEIYGPGGLFKNFMYSWMKKGRYRIIGSGNNYIPRIHVEDCAEAYLKALEVIPKGEKFILADNVPCTQRVFSDYMADCMGVSRPKSIPGIVVRLLLGNLLYKTITMNCRVSNTKAKRILGWDLKYPSYRSGLPAAIEEIRKQEQVIDGKRDL